MNKFTLGAIAGATSLALAVPMLVQISSAATGDQTSSAGLKTRPVATPPSQACVLALVQRDGEFLSTIDAMIAEQKTATQTHKDALTAAAALTDEKARQDAVKKADDALRASMEAARKAQGDPKTQMDALKTACGDSMPMMGMGGPMGGDFHGGPRGGKMGQMMGRGQDMLAQKLGMTADELKTALASGKTIQDIAKEKGITLPAKGEHGPWNHGDKATTSSSSTVTQ